MAAVETFTCLPVHSHPRVYQPMNEAPAGLNGSELHDFRDGGLRIGQFKTPPKTAFSPFRLLSVMAANENDHLESGMKMLKMALRPTVRMMFAKKTA